MNRLLATFPPFGSGDARTALQVYHEVIAEFDTEDIEAVVSAFVAGRVEHQSMTFLPPAPMFADQLRKAKAMREGKGVGERLRLDAIRQIEARDDSVKGLLDEQTRKQVVEKALEQSVLRVKPEKLPPPRTPEEQAKISAQMRKHDELFGLDMDTDEDIRRRLKL